MPTSLFSGLSAFPLTPCDSEGVVDTDVLGELVERIAVAGCDSIGLLGSTGIYAYLDHTERNRAVAAAIEAAAGRVPIIVSVGSLRTSWSIVLAKEAERLGAAGLLMAPMSYTPLTPNEVADHYRAVAGATGLPFCVYNNPSTTHFAFSDDLLAEVSALPGVAAVKMPFVADGDYAGELARLRATTPDEFSIGYSGDWGGAASLLAGGDAWYSVVGGMLPEPTLALTRAAQAGRAAEAAALDACFERLWSLIRTHGGLRVMYEVGDRLSLQVGDPPLPVRRADIADDVERALEDIDRCEVVSR